jgi:hypothetical protein
LHCLGTICSSDATKWQRVGTATISIEIEVPRSAATVDQLHAKFAGAGDPTLGLLDVTPTPPRQTGTHTAPRSREACMTVEKIIWTTLPNGFSSDGRLRVSLHVAPRLRNADGSDTPRKLGDFPTFANWPVRVNDFRFAVEFQNGPTVEGVPEGLADPALWQILFPKGTRVGPHVFQDHAKRDVHVFPVRPLLKFLEQTYGEVAATGTNFLD